MTRTGPNDVSGIIWALGTSFFFFVFFYILTNDFIAFRCSIYGLNVQGGLGMLATTKTGPNNARCVIWAFGMCFIFSSHLFDTNQHFLLCI